MRVVVPWLVMLVACGDPSGPPPAQDSGPPGDLGTGDLGRVADHGIDQGTDPDRPRRPPSYVEVAAAAGLTYVHSPPIVFDGTCSGLPPSLCLGRVLSAGATVGDVDGDGLADIFATELTGPDRLYRNRGDGTFEDVTESAGLGGETASNGAAFGDIDDDGDLDLVVLTLGGTRHRLYVNQGDGTFSEEGRERGTSLERPDLPLVGMSGCFGDFDRDGWIDLHVNEWRPVSPEPSMDATRLLRNRGASEPGSFDDVTEDAGASMVPYATEFPNRVLAFTSTFADHDEDGWPDLTIVGDFGQTRLFWNRGDGTFESGNETLGANVPSDENGMGLAIGDFDRDGHLDWFVTSIFAVSDCVGCGWHDSGNRLYLSTGRARTFRDATEEWGVRDGGWGWGTYLFDYDHDGDPDLVMTNGYNIENERAAPFRTDPMRAWRNDGDGMTEVSGDLGLTDTGQGRALVALDYDGDGDQDLLVARNQDTPLLYRRDGDGGHYLRVRVQGRGAREGGTNRRGIGARVELVAAEGAPPQKQQILGGCGFLGQSENVAHFGVGDERSVASVQVYFPVTGLTVTHRNVPADQELVIAEP